LRAVPSMTCSVTFALAAREVRTMVTRAKPSASLATIDVGSMKKNPRPTVIVRVPVLLPSELRTSAWTVKTPAPV
jgi:hypothetical protein